MIYKMKSLVRRILGDSLSDRLSKYLPSSILSDFPSFLRYLSQRVLYKKLGGSITKSHVILYDFKDVAGVARGHYFHQDLLVASFISKENPSRHMDVGSRIDGFVAHVASFREIEIIDVRELGSIGHARIKFLQRDMMVSDRQFSEITDSLSCLHTIEHFGLGRYGDPINPDGYLRGFQNLVDMLKPGGTLYISFPISKKNEVHFNAHRVFHPLDILSWPLDGASLTLQRFDYVDDQGDLHLDFSLESSVPSVVYGCGVYTFRKE